MANETNPEVSYGAEINLFVVTPEGYEGHIKLTEVPALKSPGVMQQLSQSLTAKGFKPSARHSEPKQSVFSQKINAPANLPEQPEGKPCPECGGPTEYKKGTGKNGPWAAFFCIATAKAPKELQHKPAWVKA